MPPKGSGKKKEGTAPLPSQQKKSMDVDSLVAPPSPPSRRTSKTNQNASTLEAQNSSQDEKHPPVAGSTARDAGFSTRGGRSTASSSVKRVSGQLSKEETMSRLKALRDFLSKIEQDSATLAQQDEIRQHASDLYDLIRSADKNAKVYVAGCIAEILRIFAPDHPFTMAQLQVILSLFPIALKSLANPESDIFQPAFFLLETLATVQCTKLCFDLADNIDETVLEYFSVLFDIIGPQHRSSVQKGLLDIMQQLLEEFETVSDELFDVILGKIIPPSKNENPAACTLAKNLLKNNAERLQGPIYTFFNKHVGITASLSQSGLHGQVYELLYELYFVDPLILYQVLPNLETPLKQEDVIKRREAVALVAKLLSLKGSILIEQFPLLWSSFLGRFNDIDSGIRIECVSAGPLIISNHPRYAAAILEKLEERALDQDEKVREEAVKAICNAAMTNLRAVSSQSLKTAAARRLDKKVSVRSAAITMLAKVYDAAFKEGYEEAEAEKVGWIPEELFRSFHMQETRLLVQEVVNEFLLPASATPYVRASRFVHMFPLTEYAMAALKGLLYQQKSYAAAFKSYIELSTKANLTEEESKRHSSHLSLLSLALPDPGVARSSLTDLISILDIPLTKNLKACCGFALQASSLVEAKNAILKKLARSNTESVVSALLNRIIALPIDPYTIDAIFSSLSSDLAVTDESVAELDAFEPGSTPVQPLKQYLDALHLVSSEYPALIADYPSVQDTLLAAVSSHAPQSILAALTVLRFAAVPSDSLVAKFESTLRPVVMSEIFSTSYHMAKTAAVVLVTHCQLSMASAFKKLVAVLEDKDWAKVSSALQCIGVIARSDASLFELEYKKVISSCILGRLFLATNKDEEHDDSEEDGDWSSAAHALPLAMAKVNAIKIFVRRVQGHVTLNAEDGLINEEWIAPTLKLLVALVKNKGYPRPEMKGTVSGAERSRVRLAAGCALLKLASLPPVAKYVSQNTIQLLVTLIQDPCIEVQRRFGAKLNKYLTHHISTYSLHFLSLFAFSVGTPYAKEAGELLSACAKKRREFIDSNPNAKNQQMLYLPEYSVPYLIYLIAHVPNFSLHSSFLNVAAKYLSFHIDNISKGAEEFAFLKTLIETIKSSKDKLSETSEPLYAICDLAVLVLNHKASRYGWTIKDLPNKMHLPASIFAVPQVLQVNTKRFLPADYRLPSDISSGHPGPSSSSSSMGHPPVTPALAAAHSRTSKKSPNRLSGGNEKSPARKRSSSASTNKKPSPLRESVTPTRRNASRSSKSQIKSFKEFSEDEGESDDEGFFVPATMSAPRSSTSSSVRYSSTPNLVAKKDTPASKTAAPPRTSLDDDSDERGDEHKGEDKDSDREINHIPIPIESKKTKPRVSEPSGSSAAKKVKKSLSSGEDSDPEETVQPSKGKGANHSRSKKIGLSARSAQPNNSNKKKGPSSSESISLDTSSREDLLDDPPEKSTSHLDASSRHSGSPVVVSKNSKKPVPKPPTDEKLESQDTDDSLKRKRGLRGAQTSNVAADSQQSSQQDSDVPVRRLRRKVDP